VTLDARPVDRFNTRFLASPLEVKIQLGQVAQLGELVIEFCPVDKIPGERLVRKDKAGDQRRHRSYARDGMQNIN